MTHEEAFLEAIREQPDDDTPRLIYADWLEEHGQPERAEFIRVQCEKARLPEGSPRWFELSARGVVLCDKYLPDWLGPLRGSDSWGFQLGFLQYLVLGASRVLQRGGELFRLAPIRKACLHNCDCVGVMQTLADSPLLDELESLALTGPVSLEALRSLGHSPYLRRLTTLKLNGNFIRAEG